jgi:hypothetical protein
LRIDCWDSASPFLKTERSSHELLAGLLFDEILVFVEEGGVAVREGEVQEMRKKLRLIIEANNFFKWNSP